MNFDFTKGSITKNILRFAWPLMVGNILQQLYNIVDTLIVGKFIGEEALAAVGSSYTLMIFLTSIILGLCMGNSAFLSIEYGKKDEDRMKQGIFISFWSIGSIALLLNILVYLGMDGILWFMRAPSEIISLMKAYLIPVFSGIMASFLYNYIANLLRAVGNSLIPLVFLGVSAVLNIGLDLFFVLVLPLGVSGAAIATVIAQYVAAFGILFYYFYRCKSLHLQKKHLHWDQGILREIASLSVLTCMQQSIMNFGILMVQGLVNSFGTVVMAAFAAVVKIDSFAYAPVQDFGNAFSTFIAQNYGAGKKDRIHKGMRSAVTIVVIFCLLISGFVVSFAKPLLMIFVRSNQTDILAVGVTYLWIEGSFYIGIGLLFLLYGYFRAMNRPGISVVLTVISLGTRVVLAYLLAGISQIGVIGIWAAIPIGWILADIAGIIFLLKGKKKVDRIR